MEKQEKGYHCKDCNHVLTDFRNSTQEEINEKIKNNPGKVCGIFNRNQIDYKVSHIQIPAFKTVGLSLLGILGFLGPVLTSCESDPAATTHKQNAFNLLKFPMHVKGTVKDEKTGKPLPYFQVEVLQHDKRIKIAKTDKDGNFDILIRKEDLDQEVFKLAIGGHGFERDTVSTKITRFRDKKVKLTIKAEAVTEIYTLGFIPPKVVECNTVEGMMEDPSVEILGRIPAPKDYPPEYPEIDEPAKPEPVIVTYETPTLDKHQERKIRKAEKKQLRKNDRNKEEE